MNPKSWRDKYMSEFDENENVKALARRRRVADQAAMKLYNERYNNDLYKAAIKGRSVNYANALTDEALAYCGSPYHQVHMYKYGGWSEAAVAFLAEFCREEDDWRKAYNHDYKV
jgi:hypothetical protein